MGTTRKFSIVGDSISTLRGHNPEGWRVYYEGAEADAAGVHAPEDTWWDAVIRHFDGVLVANASYSGSMAEGAGFPAGCSPERAAAAAPDDEAPDDVVVLLGINDYGWGSAAAQALGASAAAPADQAADLGFSTYGRPARPCPDDAAQAVRREGLVRGLQAQAAASPEARLSRFAAAYDAMVARLRAVCPAARIWCCTLVPGRVAGQASSTHAYALRGIPFDAYNDAIRAAAARHGARTADIRAFGQDYEATDGTHPTKRGMTQLAAMVVSAMEGRPYAGDPSLTSQNGCPLGRGTCEGCRCADVEPTRWSCVCTALMPAAHA
ncbi:SGNH/GDSL hydrolase family protein [Eggerthellaceae bacterium zg-893]|nr:SGNH/GDSL hydrolase family protein [Eggerthellaceae bacterium zg-893]